MAFRARPTKVLYGSLDARPIESGNDTFICFLYAQVGAQLMAVGEMYYACNVLFWYEELFHYVTGIVFYSSVDQALLNHKTGKSKFTHPLCLHTFCGKFNLSADISTRIFCVSNILLVTKVLLLI